jgi:excisionase family DNA binding protein
MRLYSLKEVAEMLGVTYNTVWNLVKTEKIKAVKVGRVLRIDQEEVERIMREGA